MFKGPRGLCGIPRTPVRTYSVHGGAGAILSVGLLRSIQFQDFEACVTTTYTTGDALLHSTSPLLLLHSKDNSKVR